jgi:hypothetical protein
VPFLVPYDALADDLLGTAIQMEDIGKFLELIPCLNVLLFFDSCYSGAVGNARSFGISSTRQIEKGVPVFPKIAG